MNFVPNTGQTRGDDVEDAGLKVPTRPIIGIYPYDWSNEAVAL